MKRMSDERIDSVIGVILRAGVVAAAALVLFGGILYLAHSGDSHPEYRTFQGAPGALTHLSGILHGAMTFDPLFLIQLGLIVLVATPVVRVIACVAGFGMERDWKYALISLIVLAMLLVSLFSKNM